MLHFVASVKAEILEDVVLYCHM